MNYYSILANATEEQACHMATVVLQAYPVGIVHVLSGPQQGLVMLRMRETVANSQFNAGEILVTEVKLALDGQFGYGMVIGNSSRHAMAIALVDAAMRKGESIALQLEQELIQLHQHIVEKQRQLYNLVASTRVNFEII